MNITETEKIKSLINSSSILSASEKAEWLALFDLMNDKQLVELEKILSPEAKSPPTPLPNPPPQGEGKKLLFSEPIKQFAEAKASASTTITSSQMQGQMPKLSHIMNLPKFNQGLGVRGKGEENLKIGHPIFEKKPSAFASKLKSIFQEKELPAGHAELELTDGRVTGDRLKVTSGAENQTNIPKPFFPLIEKPAPAVLKVSPPLVPKPKAVIPAVLASPLPPPPPIILKVPPKVLPPILPPKEFVNPKAPAPAPAIIKPAASEQVINTLQDLASLENQTLKDLALDTLVNKIKSLISKHGYFEVIFNVEKSKLYKNYIDTGLKLLSEQGAFESLESQEDNNYLNKEQFEKFTDLLAKIQAS